MNNVIRVKNEKAKSMIYTEESVLFLGKVVNSVDEFNSLIEKKMTLVDKGELKFADMKKLSIDGLKVNPHVGMKFGNSVSNIDFVYKDDLDNFVAHVSKLKGWEKKEVQSSFFNAIKWDLGGLLFTGFCGFFMAKMALDIEAGTYISTNDSSTKTGRRGQMMEGIIGAIGSNGVMLITLGIIGYLAYTIYKKYKNPPILVTYE